jgi:archaeosine synthase beta-subunit
MSPLDPQKQILAASEHSEKTFEFSTQDPRVPAQWWFQTSSDGLVLFVVFYTLACRWNRCVGCNLPSKSSLNPVSYADLIAQIDHLFALPEVSGRLGEVEKVILSNNGSIFDEVTFPSTALMHFMVRLNLDLPKLGVLTLETRPEYVEWEEMEFLSRILKERQSPAELELAVGFEAFDETIRNKMFNKGLPLEGFEKMLAMVGRHGYSLKCYFMLKPVAGLSDDDAVTDIHQAIDYLDRMAEEHGVTLNMHLNPTYVAHGTPLAESFARGEYTPPYLKDLARAALHAQGTKVSVYLGLYDEGLAVDGGSFIRPGDDSLVESLKAFNSNQDFGILKACLQE